MDGSEHVEYSEEVQPGQEVPDVTVELEPGKETSNTAEDTFEDTVDNIPDGSTEDNYDITEITGTIEREVTANTSEIDVTINVEQTDLEALAPNINKENSENAYTVNSDGDKYSDGLSTGNSNYIGANPDNITPPDEEGYDYLLTGFDVYTDAARAVSVDVVYKKDPVTGEPMKDADGNYIIESTKYTGKYDNGMDSSPSIFTLSKYNDNDTVDYFYGYCIDNDTGAIPGAWYKVSNLEDSNYYPDEESAAKLRAIVNNGYWGQTEGEGSAAYLQEKMLAYYDEDDEITIDDKDGNPVTFKIHDLFDTETNAYYYLTDAEALTATQAAIWTYANGSLGVQDGKDGSIIEGLYSVNKPKTNLAQTVRDYNYASDARLKALYQWLLTLEGESKESEQVTTIINENNTVEKMSLTVKDKVAGHANNNDGNKDNDVYNTDLNFKLAFIPGPNDDLLVQLTYTDLDGKEVNEIRYLTGAEAEGENGLKPDDDGNYTITGLKLSENTNHEFDLRLEGTQYLQNGVYVYTAQGGHTASQSLVGIAEGTHDVDVTVGMTISFNVDEENKVVAERKWHKKSSSSSRSSKTTKKSVPTRNTPEEGGSYEYTTYTIGDDPVPLSADGAPEAGMEEILDLEVPLAAAPETGDNSLVYAMISLISLCGIILLAKKREFAK